MGEITKNLGDINIDIVTFDGLDDALIGTCSRYGDETVALYDYHKVIDILMNRDGMSEEEAIEFAEFNITGLGLGPQTPAFANLFTDE
jgi:hypothetical protein